MSTMTFFDDPPPSDRQPQKATVKPDASVLPTDDSELLDYLSQKENRTKVMRIMGRISGGRPRKPKTPALKPPPISPKV